MRHAGTVSEHKSGTKANTKQWLGRVIWIGRSLAGVCSLVKPGHRAQIFVQERLSVATMKGSNEILRNTILKENACSDFSLLKWPILSNFHKHVFKLGP